MSKSTGYAVYIYIIIVKHLNSLSALEVPLLCLLVWRAALAEMKQQRDNKMQRLVGCVLLGLHMWKAMALNTVKQVKKYNFTFTSRLVTHMQAWSRLMIILKSV